MTTALDFGSATEEKAKGLDISPIMRMIWRNLPLIAIITLGMTGAGAYLGKQMPKSYEGGFRILVEPITSQGRSTDPSALSRDRMVDTTNNIDYPTLLQVLQSPEILGKVANQINSREPSLKVTTDLLEREITRKNLVIRRIGETQLDSTRLIEVNYKGRSPEQVQLVLDELAKGYLRYSLEDRRNRIGGGIEFIEDQLPSLQKRVNSLEAALQDLKQRYRIVNPVEEGDAVSEQLQETRAQRQQAERDLSEQRALHAKLQNQLGLTPAEALAAASLSENTKLQELVGELKKIEAQIALTAARFQEESPVLKTLMEQRKNLIQLIDAEIRRNLGQGGSGIAPSSRILAFQNPLRLELIRQLVTADNSKQLLEIRNRSINETEDALDERMQQFPAIQRQYNDLQQQLEIATKTLNQFLTQRETLRIEAAQKEVPWEVVAPPDVLKDAKGEYVSSASLAPRLMLAGLVGGLVLGFLLALMKEKFRNVYLSSEDAQGALQLPALGLIPHKRGLNQAIEPLSLNSNDSFSKSFSALYTNLRFLRPNPVRSVVINSPAYGDGKTTIAVNLGLAAAAMGQRVLLVDANLRLPELHTLVDLTNTKGLNEVLSDEKLAWESAVQRSPLDKNLSVLTAGQVALNSSRLLASNEMQTLMRRLEAAFDLVIYDTPNAAEFSDVNFLAANSDGVVMVIGINKTKRPSISKVVSEFQRFRIPILGMVTNAPGRGAAFAPKPVYDADQLPEGEAPLLESLKVFKSSSSSASGEVTR
jgi:capsular exopolysaccharide synthesis family protein